MGMMRIPCKDLEKSELFYSGLLGLNKSFGGFSEGYIGYALENIDILIELEEPAEFESGRFLGFSLYVVDINTTYNEFIERGVEFTGPPSKQTWGGLMTHIVDVSGNSFSLVQLAKNA